MNGEPLGSMARAKAAHMPLLVDAAALLHASLGLHHGRLERPLSLTTASGPVGLGFLGLVVEMFSSRPLVEQARALVQAAWSFGPRVLRVDLGGSVLPPTGGHVAFSLPCVLGSDNLRPGILVLSEVMLPQPVLVRGKKGDRHRVCSVGFRLRIVAEGSPTGAVPAAHHGAFLPLAA